jgi:hypothetical protein
MSFAAEVQQVIHRPRCSDGGRGHVPDMRTQRRCDICELRQAEETDVIMRRVVYLCGACWMLWTGKTEKPLDPSWQCPDFPPET